MYKNYEGFIIQKKISLNFGKAHMLSKTMVLILDGNSVIGVHVLMKWVI